ncbi:5-methylaminomethyl-2-thiouridylate-methyltransferase [Acaromyces ingoldii]|uniref:tRNA-5-taurinomethyluridine 2-sulfurtransferase n=1 Tax=Acaromyces ingoldii TaxID=215250 RepID=A0A316YLD7_9BASI|nr:5-methylaminomethyl-2-thiouridylate-methyltransferase [Acaromyces ingoldii]PWN88873.1 5-methylaminomethyl-2-thiouridylate-methyltransferase [Acaromyces ingoldii]
MLRVARPLLTCGRRSISTTSAEVGRLLDRYPVDRLGPQPGDEAVLTLSGGVDSSVAAFLAIERGGLKPVRTIFMRNWNSLDEAQTFEPGAGGSTGCTWLRDWRLVERTARVLGLKAELMDLSTEYWNQVFAPALDDWQRGTTPNPDVACNREIKFGELLLRAGLAESFPSLTSNASPSASPGPRRWLVTGHYARLAYHRGTGDSTVLGSLHRASDATKDQSYFLSAVAADKLGRAHFPLANLTKAEVRSIAAHVGLPTAASEESMGLCFVGERGTRGHARFLASYIDARPGNIVSLDGRTVGRHEGLHTLTVGQGARIGGASTRWFVAKKKPETNEIVVVPGADHPLLRCRSLHIDAFLPISARGSLVESLRGSDGQQRPRLLAQIRHRQAAVACTVARLPPSTPGDDDDDAQPAVEVAFDEPVVGVAQGQTCALYDGDECLGSGVISHVSLAE